MIFAYTVPATSTILLPTQDVAWEQVSRVPRGISHPLSHISNYIPVQFEFSICKLVHNLLK